MSALPKPNPQNELASFHLSEAQGKHSIWLGGSQPVPKYFPEYLPACFERTLEFQKLIFSIARGQGALEWVFTGNEGGFTLDFDHHTLQLRQRYYDSAGLYPPEAFYDREGNLPMNFWTRGNPLTKHPQRDWFTSTAALPPEVRTLTVLLTHNMMLSVQVNGEEILTQRCLIDVHRHQLRLKNVIGEVKGRLMAPAPKRITVCLDREARYQSMIGFGGTGIATAYAELSEAGQQEWWKLIAEYNLLIQREYPNGLQLKPDRSNWDTLEDATPHYYGDNFPNGNITNFAYNSKIQELGGEVWFEFWQFPPWVNKNEKILDEMGYERIGGVHIDAFAEVIVDFCRTAQERTGKTPTIIGLQNESHQSPADYYAMTRMLRQELDAAGFPGVKIHMSDANFLSGKSFRGKNGDGISRAKTFARDPEIWSLIDFASTHMYDYQEHLYDPDSFDAALLEFKQVIGDKPCLSSELAINDPHLQGKSYRLALLMGELFHKNLTLIDASALAFCWTILNVEQPSFGWTRSLFVPKREHGFMPGASSNMLRVFGSYSRRVKRGMTRIGLKTNHPDLLGCAFVGESETLTLIFLNRGTCDIELDLGPAADTLSIQELTDPYHENAPSPFLPDRPVSVPPGALLTLSNVPLNATTEG